MVCDTRCALIPLEHALTLAEPEGYVRIFVMEGAAMRQLLSAAQARQIIPGYVERLLAAFAPAMQPQSTLPYHATTPPRHHHPNRSASRSVRANWKYSC